MKGSVATCAGFLALGVLLGSPALMICSFLGLCWLLGADSWELRQPEPEIVEYVEAFAWPGREAA